MRNILGLVVGLAIVTIIIIGFINFNLFIELWVKLFIGLLFAGVLATTVITLFKRK